MDACVCMQVMDRSKREVAAFRSEVNRAKKKRRELHSLRCDLAYKLHVGRYMHCSNSQPRMVDC